MAINFISDYNSSYKNLLNQRINDKQERTTARLTAELDILHNRDTNLELDKITAQDTSREQQKHFISQSIKDILDIRERLGIIEAAGNNRPLEELFETNKGKILDTKS